MSYMQVTLADGQSKIVGILGVKWNNSDYQKYGDTVKELKESRRCQQCRLNIQHASAVWMIWVMDSIPWVRCASGNVCIPVFLVIRIVFHFTPRIPTILLWPSASATCIYDIDYELQGIALNWHHQSYWVGIIISQSHISKVSQNCRSDRQRPGPIDRTPETPGSGKKLRRDFVSSCCACTAGHRMVPQTPSHTQSTHAPSPGGGEDEFLKRCCF